MFKFFCLFALLITILTKIRVKDQKKKEKVSMYSDSFRVFSFHYNVFNFSYFFFHLQVKSRTVAAGKAVSGDSRDLTNLPVITANTQAKNRSDANSVIAHSHVQTILHYTWNDMRRRICNEILTRHIQIDFHSFYTLLNFFFKLLFMTVLNVFTVIAMFYWRNTLFAYNALFHWHVGCYGNWKEFCC